MADAGATTSLSAVGVVPEQVVVELKMALLSMRQKAMILSEKSCTYGRLGMFEIIRRGLFDNDIALIARVVGKPSENLRVLGVPHGRVDPLPACGAVVKVRLVVAEGRRRAPGAFVSEVVSVEVQSSDSQARQ